MRNKILEIVVFLIDYMRENNGDNSATDELSLTLTEMGYTDNEIDIAYDWFVEQFSPTFEQQFAEFPKKNSSTRVLTDSERMLISSDAYGFLVKLLNGKIINDQQLETILERIVTLPIDEINLEHIKMIASSLIFWDSETQDDFGFIEPLNDKSNLIH